ncbi:hypothetical protein AK88_00368 [Plasmodium fragile]|uniref:Uncharacterized protein n=1 Tax=Plasmodium fragile TaxID=5857 RepID=A0A0D9QST7_PLAFR|nr:uncharacterized protein AK88_00368 [Plasmodium fragile]KJP89912.1 hypothetical protein AK88_00368 [Plasmodium fragile]
MDEAKQPSDLCSGGGNDGGNGRQGGGSFNFDFSYESILNNDIVRPQEIDCGMSCASSFCEGNERVAPGGDYLMDSSGDPAGQPKCANYAPPMSARNTSAFDFSFQRDADEGGALHSDGALWGGGQKRGADDDAVSTCVGEVHAEQRDDPECVEHPTVNEEHLIGYEGFLMNEASKGQGQHHAAALRGETLEEEDGNTNDAQPCHTFTQKKEESTSNQLPVGEERTPPRVSSITNSRGTYIIRSPTITSTDKQGVSCKSSPSISSTRASDVSEANEIYRSLQTEIAAYRMEIFRLRSEVQVKNSYLNNERKKNEEYNKMLQKFLLEPSSCSQGAGGGGGGGGEEEDKGIGSLNLLEVENKKLRQELALRSSEMIELNNAVNNLKGQKVIFMNSLQNELEMCMSKEAESSLMLHAQTKRLANANNYINKQNKQISQLKEDLNKMEETYILHVHKMENQIKQLLEERNEFISTVKRLEVINADNKKNEEELCKCKKKCKELTEELNDLLRIVTVTREKKSSASFTGFYQDGQNTISSFASLKEEFLTGNNLKEENSILVQKIKHLMEENDSLKEEAAQRVQELNSQLQTHKESIKMKNENHAVLLERYNHLEQDFENVHLLCMQLEERFRVEQSNNVHGNGNVSSIKGSANCEQLLNKSNFSLSELEMNHSQGSDIHIQHYKIFCSELQLENESLKKTVERLKSKNRKLTTSMELLLRDLVTAGGKPSDATQAAAQAIQTEKRPKHLMEGAAAQATQTEKHLMEGAAAQATQTEKHLMEGAAAQAIPTQGKGKLCDEDIPQRHVISEGVNTEEKISTSKQVYTHENRSFANSGTNTNVIDVAHVGVNPNVIHVTDVGVNPNVINVTDVGVNPNVIHVTDVGVNPEEETKTTTHTEAQTEEVNLLVKCTQTDESSSVNREVLTDLHGINKCSMKRIMLACNSSKNKKVQVTTTTMNASSQTVEISKHGRYYHCDVRGAHGAYDSKRDRSTTRRIKRRQHDMGCHDSPLSSDQASTGEDVSYESYSTSSSTMYERFTSTNRRKKKKQTNYVPTCRSKHKNGEYLNHARCKDDNVYLHGGGHECSRKDPLHISSDRRRMKTSYNKNIDPRNNYSLLTGRKNYLRGDTGTRLKKKKEMEEVESLIEILKYSSENYESSDMDDGRHDDLNLGKTSNSFYEGSSSDYTRVCSKRLANLKKKRHSHRTHKQVRDMSEEDSIQHAYPFHERTIIQKGGKKNLMNNVKCRACYPHRVMVKENKYVQTGEYFLDHEFNYDPSLTPMGSPNHYNTKGNIKTLKRKMKEYLNDYYHTVIICEHCRGVHVDVFIIQIIREYVSRINLCRCHVSQARSDACTDQMNEWHSSRNGSHRASKQNAGQISKQTKAGASNAQAEEEDSPMVTLESFLIKRIPLQLPICTCTLVNLKYKKVLVRKEESQVGSRATRGGNQVSTALLTAAKRKKKKQAKKKNPEKELLNRALIIINHMRVELNKIKFLICNYLLLNERNELQRIFLTSPRLTDVYPLVVRKYAQGASECCTVVASSEGLLPSETTLSHCAYNNRSSNVTDMNPCIDSMLVASTNDGMITSFAGASSPLYKEVATHMPYQVANHSGHGPHCEHFVRHGGKENITLFVILSILRLHASHELNMSHASSNVTTAGRPSNRTDDTTASSNKVGSSFPSSGFIAPSGINSFFEAYLIELRDGMANSEEGTSLLKRIMNDIVNKVEENWKSIASVYLHLKEPLSGAPMQMAHVLNLIQNYKKVALYMNMLPKRREEEAEEKEEVHRDKQLQQEAKRV